MKRHAPECPAGRQREHFAETPSIDITICCCGAITKATKRLTGHYPNYETWEPDEQR